MLPNARCIFVLHLTSGNWSRYDWNESDLVRPGSLGMLTIGGIERPVAGFRATTGAGVAHDGEGHIVAFDQGKWTTDYFPGATRRVFASWISQPIMLLGHHQPRMYRHWRIYLRDCGTDNLRAFWLTDGQATTYLPADAGQLEVTGQYKDIDQRSPHLTRRWGDGLPWWDTSPNIWERGVGEETFDRRVSLTGQHNGRRIQLAVRNTANNGQFDLVNFELDTRREEGRR